MNPRAPHYKFQAPSTGNNGTDLASVFGSLRSTFVPASVPAPTPVSSTHEAPTHNRSLVKFEPHSSSDEHELLERARAELHEQSQLMMHSKLLRLSDQVGELIAQRAATEEKQAESDVIISELRSEVVSLKAQVKSHQDKLDACKRLADGCAKHARELDQRMDKVPTSMEPRFQHHETRINKVESLVRNVESPMASQIKQQTAQLQDNEKRISGLEQKTGDARTPKSYTGLKPQDTGTASQVPQMKITINKLDRAHKTHESYLKTVGETLFAHQTDIDAANDTINNLRSKVEVLGAVNAKSGGQKEHQLAGGLFNMDPAAAIIQMQSQIDRLAKDISLKNTPVESPKSETSSINDAERLLVQMDEVHEKIREMEEQLNSHTEVQHHMDECGMANKLRLEAMFYQLTMELLGKCRPGDVEFGLGEERTFILRQRVLERLSIESNVQLEFLRLQQSQQMPR